ncbi:MAG: DUF962 domain-containing protein [Proteobacteria bacterium]|nr:DUF962 domain-containing protein [Pseudomonadota bacterium]
MKNLTEQLTQYAAYHRDRRNIRTHFIGVPMIVFAVVILLSKPVLGFIFGDLPVSLALCSAVVASLYYLWLDRPLGLLLSLILAGMVLAAAPLAAMGNVSYLASGLGLFVIGWIIQGLGHVWEGKKPAFFDDVVGLMIGPLFVTCEIVFLLGGRQELLHAIEAQVGKSRIGKAI